MDDIPDAKKTKKKWQYIPGLDVRAHIAKWEAEDFAGQNAKFGGDAVGAKAKELSDLLGEDIGKRLSTKELNGLLATYYNLSPDSFKKLIYPAVKQYAMDPTVLNSNKLYDAMMERYKIAPAMYKKGIKRRAAADTKLMGIQKLDPLILASTEDGGKILKVDPSVYGFEGPKFEPTWTPAQSINTDYPLNDTTPKLISSWSGANAPNATPRILDFQETQRKYKRDPYLEAIKDILVRGKRKAGLPDPEKILADNMQDYIKNILNLPKPEDATPTFARFMIPNPFYS